MARLELRGVTKRFGALQIIKGIDLEIAHGEFVVFVGPSGCGKSTLLRMIAGLEPISSGEIHIAGRLCNDVAPRDRGIAMVFQSYALYPHMTVYDNVGFSLKLAKVDRNLRDRKIREAARILKMEQLLDRKPAQLSGGQRQRVAIGRAIVRQPDVFLFDEPLSNLDAALRGEMRMEIARLHHELGATMVYVTHDQVEAMTLADKIVVLDGGVVQQIGAPLELYGHPGNLFVAGFIGAPKMNLLPVELKSSAAGEVRIGSLDVRELALPFAGGPIAERDLVLGIRPQQITLCPPINGRLAGTVEVVEHLGDETVLHVRLPSGATAMALLQGDIDVRHGEEVGLTFDLHRAHLFLASGASLTSPPSASPAEGDRAHVQR
ncbi:ABC transporter ATP-binding protein [Oryzibacter oryziterrae]|uniref:ABC transporter ATP-binding protein n=1 Tax=Oryzibacter oryziterrae TaxID=2766474 RepID=UPI001F02C047|nr:sn-glycerol-3-phosphate ABC transporter ATP-binding protein UgpC [Oryzibacter oryziterrae]